VNSSLIPDHLFNSQETPSARPELQRESDRLKLLLDITNTLVSNLECRDLLRTVSASIRQVMRCDNVSAWLPDAQREFRSDLYYRLNVSPIRIPPLRERPEDIPLLARYFIQKHGRRMNKEIESVPAAALQAPIAELRNNGRSAPAPGTREANERDEIVRVLKITNGRVAGADGAAARMDVKRTTLISRMKKLGIDPRKVSGPSSKQPF